MMTLATPGTRFNRIAHVAIEVVADEERAVLVVLGVKAEAGEKARRAFRDADAVGAHLERHAAERRVDAVLHVDRRQVGIAPDFERHRDGGEPVVGRRRGHVDHALDAVDDRFERSGDGALDRLRVCAGVERADADRRRRELGIAADGQRRNRDGARERNEHRADRREDGPLDKDVGNHYGLPASPDAARRRHRRAVADLLYARR